MPLVKLFSCVFTEEYDLVNLRCTIIREKKLETTQTSINKRVVIHTVIYLLHRI